MSGCRSNFIEKVKHAISTLDRSELYQAQQTKEKPISISEYGLDGGVKGISRQELKEHFEQCNEKPDVFLY